MANELKMAIVDSIFQLRTLDWSARRIARELGIDRGTVGKYLKRFGSGPKPAIPPAGSGGSKPATCPPAPGTAEADSGRADSAAEAAESKPAIPPAGSAGEEGDVSGPELSGDGSRGTRDEAPSAKRGRASECEPYRAIIQAKLDLELSAQRIFQDLVSEHGFAGGYDSVKRFVRGLGRGRALPMRRMECAAGEEAQVDFGTGVPVIGPDGKRRKTHVFRVVLSHSRKAYSEATYRQTTEDFIGCLENALWSFGGCPKVLVIDNLRAAVKRPDWFDPELIPKLRSFCQHYGITILPTKPYMPRHKGKVEAGVKYVQNNALKAKGFASLPQENDHLAHWEAAVADTRIHGTTRRQVGRVFVESERPALRPLPRERFPCFQEAPRKVNRDGHVEVAKAYYSVPPEYLRRSVWARWDARLVRIFNQRFEQIAVHVRHEPGRFSTHAQHLAPEKINGLERGAGYLLTKVRGIGPHSHQWAEAMLHARGIEGTRVLQGLLSLTRRHPSPALEKACEIALSHGAFQLRTLRQLIGRQVQPQTMLPFLDEHPIIRPLADYAGVVAAALARKADSESRFLRHPSGVRGASEKESPSSVGRQGYRSIFDLVRDFLHEEALNDDKVLSKYLKPDLLIVDDMGMKQLPKRSGEYLFEIIMQRYETRSTVMTSNRPLEDWGKLVGDVPSATAILDRFLHHAEIVSITGKSYRLRNQAANNDSPSDGDPAENADESKPAIPPPGSKKPRRAKKDDPPGDETTPPSCQT